MHSRKVMSVRGWEETRFSQWRGIQVGASGTDSTAEAGAGLWIFEWNLAARRCREKLSVEDAEQLWIIHVTVSSLCFRCFRGNFIFRAGVAPTSACTEFNVDPVPRWHVARGFKVSKLPPSRLPSSSRCLPKRDMHFDAESKRWQVSIASFLTRRNAISHYHARKFDQGCKFQKILRSSGKAAQQG